MMNLIPGKGRLWTALTVLVSALMLFAAACGGDEEQTPQCTFGVADGGKCVNAERCLFQSDCLPGYSCSQGTCTADQECTADEDCDAGVCSSSGVCVNPESCTSNDECVSKTYCSDAGTCEADPCSAVTCVRGACVPGSGECTSKDSCTKSNELFDCVQGERCLDNTCLAEDDFCEQLGCERGVCSFTDGQCVPADDCGGDDAQCLEGQFCNEDNECQEDRCVTDEVTCDDGGVCVPAVGECQNAETCTSNADCLSDHWCVEGTCALQSTACGNGGGDGGCFGEQTCEYDDQNLTASCAEPDTCTTSLDCTDGRQCGGESCVAAASCPEDIFEPNNSESAATDFVAASGNQLLQADLCASDTDYYVFDSNALEPFVVRGVLTIQLQYAARDRGLGELELELLKEQTDGSFSSVTTGSAGVRGQDGEITITQDLGPADQGTFLMAVRSVGDISDAGVTYDLSVQLLDDPAINACETPREIANGEVLTSDMRQATSSLYRGSCVASDSTRAEQLFTFEVKEPSLVSASVTPETTEDNAVLSIRSTCEALATEEACSDSTTEATEEISDLLLSPGTYFIVVEPSPAGSLARYDLSLSIAPTSCADSSNFCADSNTSQYCVGGDNLETVSCTNGCDPTFGRCFPVDGDVCETTTLIDAATTETITWGELRDDYRAPSCVPEIDGSAQSGGSDQAFQVEVPAGFALSATLTTAADEDASLYVVESCTDLEGTCLSGANADPEDGAETVLYGNRDPVAKTVFLIADSAAGQALTDSQLDIEFIEIICDPNGSTANRCDPGGAAQVQNCNDAGTEYLEGEDCSPWVCDTGACITPDTCSSVVDMTSRASQVGGATITGTWNEYTSDVSGSGCTVDATDTDGYDFVVSVDLQAGEAVTANLESIDSFISSDPTLHVQSSCGALDSATCLEADHGDSAAQVVYTASAAETVYITADTASDSSSAGSENFEFNIAITDTCDPTTYADNCESGSVAYCTQRGAVANYPCSGGTCTSGLCDITNADWCFDAENITAAATSSAGFTRTLDWTQFSNDFRADAACDGNLDDFEIEGNDAYYRVDLLAGEVLSASLDQGSSFDDPALAVVSPNNCTIADSGIACLAQDESSSVASVTYTATVDETVYLIADNDDPSTTDTFDLSVSVRASCNPATFTPACQGDGVVYCTAAGFEEVYDCGTSGCSAAQCVTTNADFCFDARDITTAASQAGGTTETVDFTQYSNDFNVDGACGLDDFEIDGNDAYYSVTLQAGEVLIASLEQGSTLDDPAIALVSADNCGTANSGTSSCLGSDENFSGPATVQYEATATETVIIIADVDEPGSTATMDLNVEIREACDPATFSPVCRGDDVAYCLPDGFVDTYACGAGNCSGGTCTTTGSDFCFDAENITTAAQATGGVTKTLDWTTKTDLFEVSSSACSLTSSETAGPDAVYQVDIPAGYILSASLDQGTSSADPALAVVRDCLDASGTCAEGDDQSATSASVSYFTTTAETVFLVADSDSPNTTDTFTLTAELAQAPCNPETFTNTCDVNGDLEYCTDGGQIATYTCTNGCSGGECQNPTAETCLEAQDVTTAANATGGTTISQTEWQFYAADFTLDGGPNCSSITTSNTSGSDAVFKATLTAGQTITATVDNPGVSIYISDPVVAIVPGDACGDATQCYDGERVNDDPATATYTSTGGEDVYIMVDSDSSTDSDPVEITIDIQ